LRSRLKGYVDKVRKFKGATNSGVTVSADEIKGRALDLALPGKGSKAQQQVLHDIKAYGKMHGVDVNIIIYN